MPTKELSISKRDKESEGEMKFIDSAASEIGDLSTIPWDFKNPEDKKKVVWVPLSRFRFNPLDWIATIFSVKR